MVENSKNKRFIKILCFRVKIDMTDIEKTLRMILDGNRSEVNEKKIKKE